MFFRIFKTCDSRFQNHVFSYSLKTGFAQILRSMFFRYLENLKTKSNVFPRFPDAKTMFFPVSRTRFFNSHKSHIFLNPKSPKPIFPPPYPKTLIKPKNALFPSLNHIFPSSNIQVHTSYPRTWLEVV